MSKNNTNFMLHEDFNNPAHIITMNTRGKLYFNRNCLTLPKEEFPRLSQDEISSIIDAVAVINTKYSSLSHAVNKAFKHTSSILSGNFLPKLSKILMKANRFGKKAQKFRNKIVKTHGWEIAAKNELSHIMRDDVKALLDDGTVKIIEILECELENRLFPKYACTHQPLQQNRSIHMLQRSDDTTDAEEYSRGCTDEL